MRAPLRRWERVRVQALRRAALRASRPATEPASTPTSTTAAAARAGACASAGRAAPTGCTAATRASPTAAARASTWPTAATAVAAAAPCAAAARLRRGLLRLPDGHHPLRRRRSGVSSWVGCWGARPRAAFGVCRGACRRGRAPLGSPPARTGRRAAARDIRAGGHGRGARGPAPSSAGSSCLAAAAVCRSMTVVSMPRDTDVPPSTPTTPSTLAPRRLGRRTSRWCASRWTRSLLHMLFDRTRVLGRRATALAYVLLGVVEDLLSGAVPGAPWSALLPIHARRVGATVGLSDISAGNGGTCHAQARRVGVVLEHQRRWRAQAGEQRHGSRTTPPRVAAPARIVRWPTARSMSARCSPWTAPSILGALTLFGQVGVAPAMSEATLRPRPRGPPRGAGRNPRAVEELTGVRWITAGQKPLVHAARGTADGALLGPQRRRAESATGWSGARKPHCFAPTAVMGLADVALQVSRGQLAHLRRAHGWLGALVGSGRPRGQIGATPSTACRSGSRVRDVRHAGARASQVAERAGTADRLPAPARCSLDGSLRCSGRNDEFQLGLGVDGPGAVA